MILHKQGLLVRTSPEFLFVSLYYPIYNCNIFSNTILFDFQAYCGRKSNLDFINLLKAADIKIHPDHGGSWKNQRWQHRHHHHRPHHPHQQQHWWTHHRLLLLSRFRLAGCGRRRWPGKGSKKDFLFEIFAKKMLRSECFSRIYPGSELQKTI